MSWRVRLTALLMVPAVLQLAGCKRAPEQASAATATGRAATAAKTPMAEKVQQAAPSVSLYQPEEYLDLAPPVRDPSEIELVSVPVAAEPNVDGVPDDAAWQSAPEIVTLDRSSQQEIRIRSVHTDHEVFMLVSYADGAASEEHKSWMWDAAEGVYKQGPQREDAFVFKFSMCGNDANLSLFRNAEPHTADIWFWKACRTNPMGYADDKHQILGTAPQDDARAIETNGGGTLYLKRAGDAGSPAYATEMAFEYAGDSVPKYKPSRPAGSRADIRARGRWDAGRWTIEFARKLTTEEADDVAFAAGGRYLFGVGRYEISYDPPISEYTQPLYRTGDVFDRLFLVIGE